MAGNCQILSQNNEFGKELIPIHNPNIVSKLSPTYFNKKGLFLGCMKARFRKCQLISKYLFGVFYSSKKRTKTIRL